MIPRNGERGKGSNVWNLYPFVPYWRCLRKELWSADPEEKEGGDASDSLGGKNDLFPTILFGPSQNNNCVMAAQHGSFGFTDTYGFTSFYASPLVRCARTKASVVSSCFALTLNFTFFNYLLPLIHFPTLRTARPGNFPLIMASMNLSTSSSVPLVRIGWTRPRAVNERASSTSCCVPTIAPTILSCCNVMVSWSVFHQKKTRREKEKKK